jgi:uncharacterized protein YihD (DUF1040 family)
MKYTRLNSIGKREIFSDIEWDGDVKNLREIFETILQEIGFVNVSITDHMSIYQLKPHTALVEASSIILDRDYRIDLKFGIYNMKTIGEYSSFVFLYDYADGGDLYNAYLYKDNKSVKLKFFLTEIVEKLFEEIRECWKQSVLNNEDLL